VTDNKTSVYRGKIVELYLEKVMLPNGAQAELEIVRHPGGAAVVALDRDNRVCLLRQYRHAVGGWLWELPAGKLDPGEAPFVTAQRELEEEAGLRAARWEPLGKIISSPGVFTEIVHLFLARELATVPTSVEEHEVFESHWIAFEEAIEWAVADKLTDAKTVVGLLRARYRLGQR
jgi:8-oxo-dGTP pyrophosphatase MutT (NUDIX family)